jgi:hypothetical protein
MAQLLKDIGCRREAIVPIPKFSIQTYTMPQLLNVTKNFNWRYGFPVKLNMVRMREDGDIHKNNIKFIQAEQISISF